MVQIILLGHLQEENKVTANKMAEQTEQTQIQQVMMKDPKKVKAGKRLAEWNCKKREENVHLAKAQSESNITYYGAGAVVAIGVLDVTGYYVYQSKTPEENLVNQPKESLVHRPKETPDKYDMD